MNVCFISFHLSFYFVLLPCQVLCRCVSLSECWKKSNPIAKGGMWDNRWKCQTSKPAGRIISICQRSTSMSITKRNLPPSMSWWSYWAGHRLQVPRARRWQEVTSMPWPVQDMVSSGDRRWWDCQVMARGHPPWFIGYTLVIPCYTTWFLDDIWLVDTCRSSTCHVDFGTTPCASFQVSPSVWSTCPRHCLGHGSCLRLWHPLVGTSQWPVTIVKDSPLL